MPDSLRPNTTSLHGGVPHAATNPLRDGEILSRIAPAHEASADGLPALEMLEAAPIERAETIPSHWYVDPAFHAFDCDAVFSRSWQYVAHASQLANPGDYVTASVAANPVIVIRGKDDVVRAFYNVCRHRGGPLATDERGCAKVLQCKYHGWTYLLDGTLRGVPKFDRSELFDRRDYGLVPVALAQQNGLYFLSLADPPEPLEALLDGLDARIGDLHIDTYTFYKRIIYDVACNWKIYVDNYLEGYHIPLVHPELMTMLDYRSYETETHRWYSLQHSPIRDGDTRYGSGRAYYYFIFPNLALNILPGRLQTNLIMPVAQDHTQVVFDYFYADVESTEAVRRIEDDVAFADRVQSEDAGICEHVQRGVASRAYDRGRYSPDAEQGVYHFHAMLREAYARSVRSDS